MMPVPVAGTGSVSRAREKKEPIPAIWRKVAEQQKSLLTWPDWSLVKPLPSGPRVRTRRGFVHTNYAETTQALVQLADENGVGLEGVRLRLVAWAFRRNEDVTATLEVPVAKSFVTIARLDAWPASPHHNSKKVRKTSGLKKLPYQIVGCHVHRFGDNVKMGRGAFGAGPDGNLPVADSIPNGLGSFREFLRRVGVEFRIDGLDDLPPPDGWQGML